MNKTDFINEVAERKGITPRRAYREVNDVMDTLRVILSSGEDVQLGGFGTFEVLTDLRGERIPSFKGSKVLSWLSISTRNDRRYIIIGMAKKVTTPAAEKSDKRAKIIVVRHFGDRDFVQLYAEYVADKILESIEEEQRSA